MIEFFTHLIILPHLTRNIIPMLQLIHKPVPRIIQQQPTHTSQCLCSQKLDFGFWVLGIDETGRVDLHFFHINTFSTDRHGHLVAVTCTVVAICSWQVVVFGTVLFEQGVRGKVGCVASCGEDDCAVFGVLRG